jgi:hypothetical protein
MECNPVMERSIKFKETEDASCSYIKIQKEQHRTAKQLYYQDFSAQTLCHGQPQPSSIVLFGGFGSTSP